MKKPLSYLKSTPSNLSDCKVWSKIKILKFGTKNALFGIFHIWNQNPQISLISNLAKKQKCLNLGSKMCDSGILGLEIWKKYCHIWNRHPRIYLNAKFCEKTRTPKYGTKNTLFGYFWARILENDCHIWNQCLRICLIPKFSEETKMLKFGTKNALFEYFWPKMQYLDIFGLEF